MSLSEYSVIKREFKWKHIRYQNFMSNIEHSVITSDNIKSIDCTCKDRSGFIQASLSKIQGLLKDFPTVFKD